MGADLEREFQVLSTRLPYGLNFERHRPEAVELPQRTAITVSETLIVRSNEGSPQVSLSRSWHVKERCQSEAPPVFRTP